MLNYILHEMNDLRGEGKKRMYYKVPTFKNIQPAEFVQYMQNNKGMTNGGVVESVLYQTMQSLCDYLLGGQTVTVPHLGTFRLSIGPDKAKTGNLAATELEAAHLNAQSLTVTGVNFKPSSEFMAKLKYDLKLESQGEVVNVKAPRTSREERLELLKRHLEQVPFVKVADYMSLVGLHRTRATTELASFAAADSGIAVTGRGSHKVYVKA